MPKVKKNNDIIENVEPKKIIRKEESEDEEGVLDPDLVLGEEEADLEDEEEMLDGDDVDPFHDKWEE